MVTKSNTKQEYWFPAREGYPSLTIDQLQEVLRVLEENNIKYLPEFYSYCLEIQNHREMIVRLYYKDTYEPVPLKLNEKVTLDI